MTYLFIRRTELLIIGIIHRSTTTSWS